MENFGTGLGRAYLKGFEGLRDGRFEGLAWGDVGDVS